MATWQHLRSSTANKRPTTSLADGRIAINTNTASPGLFFKDSAGTGIVKVGPVHVGTTAPNASPAVGGSSGNYTGEQWLDTSVSPAQMKVWNGSTWVGIVADELPVSKLQDGAPRQLIQTDAAGTGVEWTSNVDVPGTLDVTSTATFDSIASHPLGSAAAPTITFTGDTNTGIYSPGADQVAVATNGTPRVAFGTSQVVFNDGGENYDFRIEGDTNANLLFVDASTDRVGIGTNTPDTPLQVIGSTSAHFKRTDNGTSAILITGNDKQWSLGVHSDDYFRISREGVGERLRITSTGLVGVGTSGPQNLFVGAESNTNSIPTNANIAAQNAGTSQVSVWNTSNSGVYSGISLETRTTGASRWLIGNEWKSEFLGDLFFRVRNGSATSTEALRITSAGQVGIGTTSPDHQLVVGQNAWIGTGGGANTGVGTPRTLTIAVNRTATDVSPSFQLLKAYTSATLTAGGFKIDLANATVGSPELAFYSGTSTGNSGSTFVEPTWSERMRIDSSGRLLVGTSSSIRGSKLQILSTGNDHQSLVGGNQIAQLELCRSSNSAGGAGVVASGDVIARIECLGNDGSAYRSAARIEAVVDGTPGTNDMPGRLVFSTTADGASSPTERMRITQDGSISTKTAPTSLGAVGLTVYGASSIGPNAVDITRSGGYVLAINRTTNDGNLIEFYQDTTLEGSISVSGTTVSYNGAHLSRWSQVEGIDPHNKADRPEILRGTVMSNLDEMCDWIDPESGEAQDNEQLNKTKISEVEGDKNVAGIFQSWDDDDDTWVNDFYLAMTGDFVIRIAAGVTVERGDLLMSAGDGTAKPQDDDIIRSKTIAKVTSTNVSCTYDDGSYCVPCVLMAC